MSTISASTTTTTAFKVTADTTGTLVLQTGSTPTTAMTFDASQRLGVNTAPSTWGTSVRAVQLPYGSIYSSANINGSLVNGYYKSGASWAFLANGYAPRYEQNSSDGGHYWATSNNNASGADAAITYNSSAMVLDASANLKVYSDVYVNGTAKLSRNPAVAACNNATQTFSAATTTKVLFQTATFDTNSCFSSSTFTPNVPGYYLITAQISAQPNSSNEITLQLAKNGSTLTRIARSYGSASSAVYFGGSYLVYMNGSTDYIDINLYTQATFTSETPYTLFNATFVRNP